MNNNRKETKMNTTTKTIHLTINYLDAFGNQTSKSGTVETLDSLTQEIGFIGVERVISVEFTK